MAVINLTIRTIDFTYDDANVVTFANVRYDSVNKVDGTYMNGSVKLTSEEYSANDADNDTLSAFVKQKIIEKLQAMV